MIQLRGGSVAVRILGELWQEEKVDSDTAVWLIDRILQKDSAAQTDEIEQAIELLGVQARCLVPRVDDAQQYDFRWPGAVAYSWPTTLSYQAKGALLLAIIRVLLARDIAWWRDRVTTIPVDLLIKALDDPDFGYIAARVLQILFAPGVFKRTDFGVDGDTATKIESLSTGGTTSPWVDHLIGELTPWAKGQQAPNLPSTRIRVFMSPPSST